MLSTRSSLRKPQPAPLIIGGFGATVIAVPRGGASASDVETSVQTLALVYSAHATRALQTRPTTLLDSPASEALLQSLPHRVLVITAWREPELGAWLPGYVALRPSALFPSMGVRLHVMEKRGGWWTE